MNGLAIKTDLPSAPNVRLPTGIDREKVKGRFWVKVNRDGPNGCWNWLAYKTSNGYGTLTIKQIKFYAHRFAYEFFREPIPKGLQLDHLCRNHACVNPTHMELVTCRQNILRGIGLAAQAARRSSCAQGHPYNLFNTHFTPDGMRDCRICRRIRKRKSHNEF